MTVDRKAASGAGGAIAATTGAASLGQLGWLYLGIRSTKLDISYSALIKPIVSGNFRVFITANYPCFDYGYVFRC